MAVKTLRDIGEFGLIERVNRLTPADPSVLIGIGDDAAAVTGFGKEILLLATDMLTEGVHFTARTPPEGVGYKALACNISDIAAMGGTARYALVSIGVPPATPLSYVTGLYRGMARLAKKFKISIVGGDTVRSVRVVVNVALAGSVRKKDLVTRKGARPGDVILVTGPLGGSWRRGKDCMFTPRVAEAQFLLENGCKPTAMIDISDGLVADLGHVLEQSGVAASLERARIPVAGKATLQQALYDGEDFELLLTLPPSRVRKLGRPAGRGFRFIPVGIIQAGKPAVFLRDAAGKIIKLRKQGYSHFTRKGA
jgi:thiamine-monophosphate kinase